MELKYSEGKGVGVVGREEKGEDEGKLEGEDGGEEGFGGGAIFGVWGLY